MKRYEFSPKRDLPVVLAVIIWAVLPYLKGEPYNVFSYISIVLAVGVIAGYILSVVKYMKSKREE